MWKYILAVALSIGFFASCRIHGTGFGFRGAVERALRQAVDQPVFPPKEDVFVGDVYLVRDLSGSSSRRVWLYSANLNAAAQAFYGSHRPSFPQTKNTPKKDDELVGSESAEGPVFASFDGTRLRTADLPEVRFRTTGSADIGLALGVAPEKLNASITSDSSLDVEVRYLGVESYGLPLSQIMPEIMTPDRHGWVLSSVVADTFQLQLHSAGQSRNSVVIQVITEVYYARAVQVTIRSASSEKLGGSFESAAPSLGTSVEFDATDSGSVVLRRSYRHPVAVGFNCIEVEIDPVSARPVGIAGLVRSAPYSVRLAELERERDQLSSIVDVLNAQVSEANANASDINPQAALSGPEFSFPTLDPLGIDYAARDGVLVFSVPSDVAFESGESVVSIEGEHAFAELALILKSEFASGALEVAGHTDSDPVNKSKFASNMDLSLARALAVANNLVEQQGVAAERIRITGYGAFRPIVPNTSHANKARNRRIELRLLEFDF